MPAGIPLVPAGVPSVTGRGVRGHVARSPRRQPFSDSGRRPPPEAVEAALDGSLDRLAEQARLRVEGPAG
ncbi:hypothetical protein OG689_39655 [Kitasatospora sp. NBC_00240]|uniref:hypothetical protein n=1 Tax=Kitasatospora sp. NBC_00240 TaxID=2903567 RepID=UPI00225541EB|nr:hypothetical protein [Kitasatospora sp. NBC_00240]MCX5215300.1 hypothetical protein [Kitasatospora sp. NBC_00240]